MWWAFLISGAAHREVATFDGVIPVNGIGHRGRHIAVLPRPVTTMVGVELIQNKVEAMIMVIIHIISGR